MCSISWSRNGHKITSASTDNTVCIWDVLSGECDQKYRFPCPVLKVQFQPRSADRLLVCPMKHAAVIVDVNGRHQVLPVDDDVSMIVIKFKHISHLQLNHINRNILIAIKNVNKIKCYCVSYLFFFLI